MNKSENQSKKVSSFPSVLQSAEDARRAQLTRQECTDTWNPRLTAFLVAYKCATPRERQEFEVSYRIQQMVKYHEARIAEREEGGQ